MVAESGSSLMELPGVGPIVATRVLADVGDVTRFADRNLATGAASCSAARRRRVLPPARPR